VELIRDSQYAIHDLSRIQASKKGEYFRLNMPFELGLDIGCATFANEPRLQGKRCLILEKERYRYQIAISDLSNSDIEAHHTDPVRLVAVVRNWLANEVGLPLPVAVRKDDAPAADQAAVTKVATVTPFFGGGGLIQTTSG
jgi:hypothetical protein